MSALRVPGPDGRIRLIDQGPSVGRVSFSRYATRGASIARTMLGGSNHGEVPIGESERDRAARLQREWKRSHKANS